jgi:hypothetical protein
MFRHCAANVKRVLERCHLIVDAVAMPWRAACVVRACDRYHGTGADRILSAEDRGAGDEQAAVGARVRHTGGA